jgi:transketolase
VKESVDLFVVSEMPMVKIPAELESSLTMTKNLIVIEEHVKRGGLREKLSALIMERGIGCRLTHLHAKGYPDGLYGSQPYHQRISGLDPESIASIIRNSR